MLNGEFKKEFFDFCHREVKKAVKRSKEKHNFDEYKSINSCILNVRVKEDSAEEVGDFIQGETDVNIDPQLNFSDTIENDDVAKFMGLLSDVEQEVVSLRLRYQLPVVTINARLKSKRIGATSRVFKRAIGKLQKNLNVDRKGE